MQFIGQNVKWYREHKRLTQQEVADTLNTTLGRVKTYESGAAIPPVEILINIATWIDVSIDALIKVKLSEKNYLKLKKETEKENSLFSKLKALEQRVCDLEMKIKK
jgi:transcriptional regulator with XRE-family HTH domain